MKNNILILLLTAGLVGLAGQLHAQIIDNTTPYSFTDNQAVVDISGSNLLLEAYDYTDGGADNDWVVTPPMEEGEGPLELQYATTSAQWLTGGPVTFGSLIGSNGTYSGNFPTASSSFTDAYYGLEFTLSAGNVEYGWVELSENDGTGTLVAAALDTTTNESIPAGAVPEPSTYAIFGLGSLFLVAIRRRRAA